MLLTKKVYRTIFLDALKENGLTVYFNKNGHFILIKGNDSSRIVSVQLVCSIKVDPILHGSHNNNVVDGIGHFKFTIPTWEDKINYYIFAMLNTSNHEIEFVIVPDAVLRNRFQNQNRIPVGAKKAELTLWLMPDKKVYEKNDLSMEGEWYFFSAGSGGKMADGGEMDYSEYFNDWNQLTDSLVL
jgi:hypothetical protein